MRRERKVFRKAEELEETGGGAPLSSITLTWTPADDRCQVQTQYLDCGNSAVPLGKKTRRRLRALADRMFAAADRISDNGPFDHPILLTVDTPTGLPTKLTSDPGDVCRHEATHELAEAAARQLRKRLPDWQALDIDGIVDTYLRIKRKPRKRLKMELLACPLSGVPVEGPPQTC